MNTPPGNLHTQVITLIENIYLQTGVRLDLTLSGSSLREAVHIIIDPAMEAIVRTEQYIRQWMSVDLRELENVSPPVATDNLFISFTASSAGFKGLNAVAFGIHMTGLPVTPALGEILNSGVFVPNENVLQAYRLVVFVKAPGGEIHLAKTAVAIGLAQDARLISYLAFQADQGLAASGSLPPSRLNDADRQVLLYVFLALTVFMTVNQGEMPLLWLDPSTVVIGA